MKTAQFIAVALAIHIAALFLVGGALMLLLPAHSDAPEEPLQQDAPC
jgi:hypothetical protein